MPFDPGISLLGIYLKDIIKHLCSNFSYKEDKKKN